LRWGMTFVMFQKIVAQSIFICVLSVFVEQSRESELRATLEAKASKELEASVEAVLATICDAVVLLSSSFQLLRPSPHLAGMLLRSSSSAVFMTGGNFIDLLVESDRDSFLQFMGDLNTHAKMLHARMRDANSSSVTVHFYHMKYLDLEGQPVHIIGIREDSEENRPQTPQELQSSLSRQAVDEVWDRAHESRASSNNNSNNNRSTASSISGSSDPMPLVEGDHAMSRCVLVDASSIDLTMVKCTPEFSAWSGPSGLNVGLLIWVAPADQSHFYEFFHKALHHYIQCSQDGSESVGPGSLVLKLQPPHWGRSIEAEAEIVEFCAGRSNNNSNNNNNEGRSEDSLSEPRILGCVSFKSVRTTQKRSKRTSRLAAAAAKRTMARPSSSAVASAVAGSAAPEKLQL
ncbi:unnamed protein product, partial [Polarella glacialis]